MSNTYGDRSYLAPSVLNMQVRDYIKELNDSQRLKVVEESCDFYKTLITKEAVQPAIMEVSYSSSWTFKEAVASLNREPHMKRLEFMSLSIPLVLDSLVKLFVALSLVRVDSVVVHHAGSTFIRFKNTNREPTADSCSMCLSMTKLRMYAANAQPEKAALDLVKPVIIAGVFALVAVTLSRVEFN